MLSPVYLLFTRDQNDDDDNDDDDIHSQMQVLLVVQVHKLLEMHTLQNASHYSTCKINKRNCGKVNMYLNGI